MNFLLEESEIYVFIFFYFLCIVMIFIYFLLFFATAQCNALIDIFESCVDRLCDYNLQFIHRYN